MTPREQQTVDELRGALRDLAFGAAMMLQPPTLPSSALFRYASEVKRVAEAALGREVKI